MCQLLTESGSVEKKIQTDPLPKELQTQKYSTNMGNSRLGVAPFPDEMLPHRNASSQGNRCEDQ
jgi:hypothetical protein